MKIKVKKRAVSMPKMADSHPEFSIDSKQYPDVKNWEVGKKCNFEIKGEITGLHKSQYDPNNMMGTVKILEINEEEKD